MIVATKVTPEVEEEEEHYCTGTDRNLLTIGQITPIQPTVLAKILEEEEIDEQPYQ